MLKTVSDELRTRFLDLWDLEEVATVFDNGGDSDIDPSKPYVRYALRPNFEERVVFGEDSVYRAIGRVWLQVFVPITEGSTTAYELADQFASIFREWRGDTVITFSPVIDTVGSDDKWYQVNVSVKYEARYRV